MELTKPSKGLADKVVRKLNFEERLNVKWNNGESDIQESAYSFEEAAHFLMMDENLLSAGPNLPCLVDFDDLGRWIDETIGDRQLTLAIYETTKGCGDPEGPYPREFIKPVKELVETRLAQCKEVLKEITAAQNS